jgi:hypothetical protein
VGSGIRMADGRAIMPRSHLCCGQKNLPKKTSIPSGGRVCCQIIMKSLRSTTRPSPRTPAGEPVLIVNVFSKGRFAGTALTALGFVLSACWLGVEAHREEKGRRDALSWVAAAGAAQPRQTAIQPAAARPPAVSFF